MKKKNDSNFYLQLFLKNSNISSSKLGYIFSSIKYKLDLGPPQNKKNNFFIYFRFTPPFLFHIILTTSFEHVRKKKLEWKILAIFHKTGGWVEQGVIVVPLLFSIRVFHYSFFTTRKTRSMRQVANKNNRLRDEFRHLQIF